MTTYGNFFSGTSNFASGLTSSLLGSTSLMGQPMQTNSTGTAIGTAPTHINQNYKTIAQDFITQYSSANALGFACVGSFYNSEAICTLHIHKATEHMLFETAGYTATKNKLAELGITVLKYSGVTFTAQPVGRHSVLITYHGQIDVNGKNYSFDSTVVVKIGIAVPSIINQMLQIFM
jgi:hypothetical protein